MQRTAIPKELSGQNINSAILMNEDSILHLRLQNSQARDTWAFLLPWLSYLVKTNVYLAVLMKHVVPSPHVLSSPAGGNA